MKIYYIFIFIVFAVLIIIPTANAQNLREGSDQKSVQVTISPIGEMQVIHVIRILDVPSQIDLIDGTISNLTVRDQEGNDLTYGSTGNDNSLVILPTKKEVIIEYDLSDKLFLKNNIWTLDFSYLESTAFIFPEQVDVVFVNNQPAYLSEKNGILCHGCKMVLEYSLDEPKIFKSIKIQDDEFLIEIKTWGTIDQFSFDPVKGINFKVIEKNNFVSTIIPVNFLSDPYQVFLDEEKIVFHTSFNNETHVWLNMRPQNSGEVSIIGTIVPEYVTPVEEQIQLKILVVGIIIIGVVIVGVFFFKRKK